MAEAFAEASAHELKVLVAIMECGGTASEEQILEKAGISKSRLAAALTLWQGEEIIEKTDTVLGQSAKTPYGNTVADEFEERVFKGELHEQTAKETAESIRDNNLASVIDECAKLMGKINLTPMEVKRVSSLSSQYGFSEEYIAMLMYHLSEKSVLTVNRLINKAIKLADDNINTVEDLERYLAKAERESGEFNEIRRVLGIYDRFLSVSEEKYFRKWLYEYCYGAVVIALAYDYSVLNKGKKDLRYMEKLMNDWHGASCRTEAECRDRYEQRRAEQDKEAAEKRTAEKKTYSKPEREKPRYGNFDAEEAFRLALARSFPGEEKDEEGK